MTEVESPTLSFLLHEAARLLRKRFEQVARDSDLTRSQWQVVAYLDQNEGINQIGLAELLDVEPITLSRILDKLEAGGLIERHPDPSDRRARILPLAPARIDFVRIRHYVLLFLQSARRPPSSGSLLLARLRLAAARMDHGRASIAAQPDR